MVSPPPEDDAPAGGVVGGPLLTSRLPFSLGSSGTLMVSPGPMLSDIVEDYIPRSAGTTTARSGVAAARRARGTAARRPGGSSRKREPSRNRSRRDRSPCGPSRSAGSGAEAAGGAGGRYRLRSVPSHRRSG